MRKKYFAIALFCIIYAGCERQTFGVDETVWTTLSESEREKVIEGYNERKAIELLNVRHRQEMDAQTAPIYAVRDVITSIYNKGKKKKSLQIQSISSEWGDKTIMIGDEQFEISWFTKMSPVWVKGQRVTLTDDKEEFAYPITIKNLDNGETVKAKKN